MDELLGLKDPDFGIEVDKAELLPLLERALVCVPGKDSDPYLLNFSLESSKDTLVVSSSDSKVSLEINTEDFTCLVEGIVLIPAKELFEIVKSCDAGSISITAETDNRVAVVHSGGTVWSLKLTIQKGFPEFPEFSVGKYEKVSSVELFQAIARTKFAASQESLRPHYLLVDISSGTFSATDGLRFQQVRTDLETSFCLPVGVISDVFKLWKLNKEDEVYIGTFENNFVFVFGKNKLAVQKPAFNFPSTEQIFQQAILANDESMIVSREALLKSISKVRHTVDVETAEIKLVLKKNTLEVRSVDRAGNRTTSMLECSWEGASRELVVNYKHLHDALYYLPETQACFYLGTDSRAKKSMILLKSTDKKYLSVISQIISNRK